jgi:hypothetical protein
MVNARTYASDGAKARRGFVALICFFIGLFVVVWFYLLLHARAGDKPANFFEELVPFATCYSGNLWIDYGTGP